MKSVDTSRILPLAVVAASFIISSNANADRTRRPQRPHLGQVAVPTSKLAHKRRAPSVKARPQLSADDILAVQHKVEPYRDRQITLMEQLVRDTPDTQAMSMNKADLLFRLAEMYANKARYLRYRAMELASRIDRAAASAQPKLQRAQRARAKQARALLKRAAATYARVYRDDRYDAYPRRAEVLFYGARSHAEIDEHAEARRAYHALIKDHPRSAHVGDAYLAFADHYFEAGALANAEAFYNKILALPTSPVHPYARYKLAWVKYNLGAFADAQKGFYQVARAARNKPGQKTLYRAASKDFVRTFAEIGRPDSAHRTFSRLDRDGAFAMLQNLAGHYLEQGKNPAAIYVLRQLLTMRPGHELACSWHADIARATLAEPLSHADKAGELHALAGTATSAKLSRDALAECRDAAAELVGTMARTWHNEGLKTGDRDTLNVAAGLYQRHLDSFKDASDRGETEYYRAELLWSLADSETRPGPRARAFERAARAFAAAVDGGRLPSDKIKESAYAAVLGWQYALADQPASAVAAANGARNRATNGSAPLPISARDRQMLKAFDLYLAHVKDRADADRPGIAYLKARTYMRYHRHDDAIPLLADIVERHLDHDSAPHAVASLLDALVLSEREDQLIARVGKLRRESAFLAEHQDLATRVAAIERTHRRKHSERLEAAARERGDNQLFVQCGTSYIELYNSDPAASDGDELLFNAAVCFENGKSLGSAIQLYQRLFATYPRSAHAGKAMARLGVAFARAGYYRQAADTLERYGRRFSGQTDAEQALSDAVFYFRGTGESRRALSATYKYIRQFGKVDPGKAAEAMYNATAIHEDSGDPARAIAHLRTYLRRHAEAGGLPRRIAAHVRLAELLWRESCPVADGAGVAGACIRVSTRRVQQRGRRRPQVRSHCGDSQLTRIKVVDRDRRAAQAARRELDRALDLYRQHTGAKDAAHDAARVPAELRRSLASARFLLAEAQYEQFLAIQFPAKLDFDPRNPRAMRRSQQRFADWLKKKLDQGASTRDLYRQAQIGDAHHAIASAARMGQLSQNFANALYSAEVPRHLRTGAHAQERVAAYCDALATEAEPLEGASIDAFGACLKTSTRVGQFSEFSRLCERELGKLRPEQFPAVHEKRAQTAALAPIMSVEPAIF